MDLLRYVSALAAFVGSSLVLAVGVHLFLMWRSKRKNPVSAARPE